MPISSAFPFESKFVMSHGKRLHYVEQGQGTPILFLHGMPVHSYMWRNVIPHTSKVGRSIALDLYGAGKSDKPTAPVGFNEHVGYVAGFVEALGLKNIVLVVMDFGSPLGFAYARGHPNNVAAIAFWEAIVRPITPQTAPLSTRLTFKVLNSSFGGTFFVQRLNVLIRVVLHILVERKLDAAEVKAYGEPYSTYKSRYGVRACAAALSVNGSPKESHDAMLASAEWLTQSAQVLKLFIKTKNGTVVDKATAAWIEASFPNLTTVDLGKGSHFVQEEYPDELGEILVKFIRGLAL
jgi:haloalkane dehalogenase